MDSDLSLAIGAGVRERGLAPLSRTKRFSRNIRKNFFFRILISGSRVLDSLDYYFKKKFSKFRAVHFPLKGGSKFSYSYSY